MSRNFSQWLQNEIYLRGLDRSELANRVGHSRAVITAILNGRCNPSAETCLLIACVLNLPASEVLNKAGRSSIPSDPTPRLQVFAPILAQLDDDDLDDLYALAFAKLNRRTCSHTYPPE